MGKWQNLEKAFFEETEGKYNFPIIEPVYELPNAKKHIQFSYMRWYRADRYDRPSTAIHFFEYDCKFECLWNSPDRYAESLKDFAYIIGPDFSVYDDFPLAVRIYNHYRNNWLVRYLQVKYNMCVIPTVMWGKEDTWDWCFDGLPKNSIVAVSNVGVGKAQDSKDYFYNGYNEMLKRLTPKKVLFFTRTFPEVAGNVEYIRWEMHKGDQLNGARS